MGPAIVPLARSMGLELKAWQLSAFDVIGELVQNADGMWVPAYSDVVLSVGRRAGKTLGVFLWLLSGMIAYRDRRVWFTAQDRATAAVTMLDDWLPLLDASDLRDSGTVTARLSNGSELIRVPRRGSVLRLFAPKPNSLHSASGDVIVFDEAWAHSLERGLELETAARPLTATRPMAQKVVASAAGTVDSTWLLSWIEAGREAVLADRGRGICHVEWTGEGTGLDLDSPEVWPLIHPGGIDPEFLRGEYEHDPAQFRRGYLNITDRTGGAGSPILPTVWAPLAGVGPDWSGPIALGVDLEPGSATAAIVACGGDGADRMEVVDVRQGDDWITSRVIALMERWPDVCAVGINRFGAGAATYLHLKRAGVPVVDLASWEISAAASDLVSTIRTGSLRYRPDPALDLAVAGCRKRQQAGGAWTFSHETSTEPVSPLVAMSLAKAVHPVTRALY